MFSLGLDPGSDGAMALISRDRSTVILEKFEGRSQVEINAVLREWSLWGKILAALEKVHSMPGQGVSSTFTFGKNTGFLQGLLVAHEIPYYEVDPQRWQRLMALGGRYEKRKKKHKEKAERLFPTVRGITQKTADGLLIAEYAWRMENI